MRLDADALVSSGLDHLAAAIDGGSSATYGIYRRGGDFDLVIDNLRAIVRARRAQSSLKPWLVWKFLAFEHNVHEIEATAALAREIGVDQFVVAKPHSVEHDDPDIKIAEQAPFGDRYFAEARNWCATADRASVESNAERIESAFRHSWMDRFRAMGDVMLESRSGDLTCSWLYYSLTMDAARRITPCCLPPMGPPEPRHLVFAKFTGKNTREVVNSPGAIQARRACRSGQESDAYCTNCHENPPPPMLPDVAGYVLSVDERHALPGAVHSALAASPLFEWTP
jgi:MoaA/NifB/PqqE/SkfB family radical SAM enzyme